MSGNSTSKKTRVVSGEVIPASLPVDQIRLTTPEDIRREMARVYREARRHQMDTREAGSLVYILSQLVKAYELGVIERRIAELEANVERKRP